jgi:dihydrodipicolinate synthase/N-acetylneuraminate lyase
MLTATMRGVVPILVTPFDERGQIDLESLAGLVEFNLAAGVHGLGVALGSEIFKLSEAERNQVISAVVAQVRGRVPVVINTGAAGTDLAMFYSKTAEELGADALMIIPPAFMPASQDEVREYYRTISEAVHIPIFIQDTPAAPVSASLARQLAQETEHVRYIKVETVPITSRVADMVAQAGEQLVVFGGAGGSYFIEELRRGSQGTMPFCSQPETFVEVWDLCRRGEEAKARALFDRVIMPINRLAAQGSGIFYHVHKELLRRRGIIQTATVRSPSPPVDDLTRRELAQLIDELYPENV